MYLPHTVTLYNIREDPETFARSTNITILRGVFLDESKASNVNRSGLEGADAANLYIPFNVSAEAVATGCKQSFVMPVVYNTADDIGAVWTLTPEDECFFVKGEIVETDQDFQYINAHHSGVYRVTKVDTKDFGTPDMRHWEVGGK